MIQAKIFEFLKNNKADVIIVSNEKEAKEVCDVAEYFELDFTPFPDFRARYPDDLRSFKEERDELFAALWNFYTKDTLAVVPLDTAARLMPSRRYFKKFDIEFAGTLNLAEIKERLLYWGYSFVDIVEEKGEVSFRGDIIDIFPIDSAMPYRISLFDDEIESIRHFEPETQKSIKEEIEKISIIPAFLALEKEEYEKLEAKILESESDAFIKDIDSLGFWYIEDKKPLLQGKRAFFAKDMQNEIDDLYQANTEGFVPKKSLCFETIGEPTVCKEIEPIDLNTLIDIHKEKKITVLAKNESMIRRSHLKSFENLRFVYKDIVLNILTDEELILSLNRPVKKRRVKKTSIILDELQPGDYVVHENHGIGIFEGISPVTVLGATKDFVTLRYQGDDKLLVPVENLDLIDRYIADSGSVAVLDRLGSGSFNRLKKKAKERLFEIASEIVKIAAKREISKGVVCNTEVEEIKLFQNDAGFIYTEDQIKSIEDIFCDLGSGRVMDRLLSGDVGFGKTEVAMNAIFAVVKNGYQAAMIAPTTLLSSQHYKTLVHRFEKYGIKTAKLDRFVSQKEKKAVLEGLEKGTIDVVVGTHTILGAKFSNLALVVIDEEHKFGVKQKEKLKELRTDVHILSMSATPIPRSLNMALSRLKELSELRTPPESKMGVRTYVKEYDEKLIKEVILRERRRGGQVFYIYNSIAAIEDKKRELLNIVADLKILVLHSRVSATVSEKELLRFEKGEYDVLLSTSIVESGLHMPNVNTIIVDGADRFGIADLHQLRGRVGRGKKEGYCYFLVENKEKITDEAKKRLIALESNSYLGSGQVLAYHDLEIRGGGNLIGAQQSGHIKNIGYSLYLRMLEDAINALTKNEEEKQKVEIKLSINAYISKETVKEDRLRLELYRRLSHCENVEEVYEIEEEMEDRFGRLDNITKQFIDIVIMKILAIQNNIKSISNYNENITILYTDEKKEHLKARSKDDDDIVDTVLRYLRKTSGSELKSPQSREKV
ncbi:transcription-repair coupling factor [Nitrosophilus alvini]|uniref:transcription-repair coupling factor n=1 Tax=Nitrosophilus alvini TaxID=2714855 RepID=UPI001F3D29ED|nr:transcription-repair coupling factor [Nitrosophilus alvini]